MIVSIDIGKLNFSICATDDSHTIIEWQNTCLVPSTRVYFDTDIYVNMVAFLDSFSVLWPRCSIILVEKQMMFGTGHSNIFAYTMQCYVESYFLMKYPTVPCIAYPAYHKTQNLNAPKHMTKPQRKKWTVEYVRSHLQDVDWLERFNASKKKDDLADTWCMIQAYRVHVNRPVDVKKAKKAKKVKKKGRKARVVKKTVLSYIATR